MQKYSFDIKKYKKELTGVINDLLDLEKMNENELMKILRRYPKDGSKVFRKDHIIAYIDFLITTESAQALARLQNLRSQIQKKPTRTISGVTTVTVLTKPFPCPGQCIFCPNDIRMPKSYIANEPGAQRALMHRFSPYNQVFSRLQAYKNNGHPTEKIELLVLGGTWTYYPINYKRWFIKECFRAMNEFEKLQVESYKLKVGGNYQDNSVILDDLNDNIRKSVGDKPYNQLIASNEYKTVFNKYIEEESETSWDDLEKEQEINSHGKCRCVGLVLETRPDAVNEKETLIMRHLGATKIQLGIQTLDDEISDLNKRGEHKEDVINAFRLLRAAGFKIHAHIMPGLFGASVEKDLESYKELFESDFFKPDELKIYPTSVIKYTKLHDLYQQGKYRPYNSEELIELITECIAKTPEYCRLTRIIRDIPSTEIEGGNKKTNLREIVEKRLKVRGISDKNIRAREIRKEVITLDDLSLDIIKYNTSETTEYFLQYITNQRNIAGFLRLSIPKSSLNPITPELNDCAMIREVHVYGPSLELQKNSSGEAQHLGLGTKLIEKAKEITTNEGFDKLAVISSIGTREYYEKRGFKLNQLYQVWEKKSKD
jgi:elongator complex protein 3